MPSGVAQESEKAIGFVVSAIIIGVVTVVFGYIAFTFTNDVNLGFRVCVKANLAKTLYHGDVLKCVFTSVSEFRNLPALRLEAQKDRLATAELRSGMSPADRRLEEMLDIRLDRELERSIRPMQTSSEAAEGRASDLAYEAAQRAADEAAVAQDTADRAAKAADSPDSR